MDYLIHMEDGTSLELYHHGVLGQKWGIRRYQNKDGTRTTLGRKHELKLKGPVNTKKQYKYAYRTNRKNFDSKEERKDFKKDLRSEQKENLKTAKADWKEEIKYTKQTKSFGQKVAGMLIAGPLGNSTYNRMLASGHGNLRSLGAGFVSKLLPVVGTVLVNSSTKRDYIRKDDTWNDKE